MSLSSEMVMPLGKQHTPNRGRAALGRGLSLPLFSPLSGGCPGQVGAVGSQVWPSEPPWLRAVRWQLLSRWSRGCVHHPSSHTPHPCIKLQVWIYRNPMSAAVKWGFKEQQNTCKKANLTRKKFYCMCPMCLVFF